jgi:hypothetical protein
MKEEIAFAREGRTEGKMRGRDATLLNKERCRAAALITPAAGGRGGGRRGGELWEGVSPPPSKEKRAANSMKSLVSDNLAEGN